MVPRFLPSQSILLYFKNSFLQLRSPNHNFKRFYMRETPLSHVDSWYFATKALNCLFKCLVPWFLPSRSVLIYFENTLSQLRSLNYNFERFYRRETPLNRVDSWYFATKALYCLFKSLVPRFLPSTSILLYFKNSLSQLWSLNYNFERFYRREMPQPRRFVIFCN